MPKAGHRRTARGVDIVAPLGVDKANALRGAGHARGGMDGTVQKMGHAGGLSQCSAAIPQPTAPAQWKPLRSRGQRRGKHLVPRGEILTIGQQAHAPIRQADGDGPCARIRREGFHHRLARMAQRAAGLFGLGQHVQHLRTRGAGHGLGLCVGGKGGKAQRARQRRMAWLRLVMTPRQQPAQKAQKTG